MTPYQFVRSLVMKVGSGFPADSRLMPVLYRVVLAEEQFSLAMLDEQLAQLQTGGAVQTDKASAADAGYAAPAEPVFVPKQEKPPVQEPVPAMPVQAPEAPVIPEEQPLQEEPDDKDSLLKKLFGSSKPQEKPVKALKNQKPAKAAKEKPSRSGFGMDMAIPGMSVPAETPEEAETAPEPVVEESRQAAPKKNQFGLFQKKNAAPAPEVYEKPRQTPVAAPAPQQQYQQPQGGGYTCNLDGMDSGMPLATSPMMDMGNAGGCEPLWLVRRSTGQRVQITHSNFHIGRGQDLVDFFIATSMQYMGVDHAYILIQGNTYYFVDNNSKNHSWLNGTLLEGSRPYPIHAGDYLRLADEYFDVVSC